MRFALACSPKPMDSRFRGNDEQKAAETENDRDRRFGALVILCLRTTSPVNTMNRLTITLSATRYRALKEASARRGKTIGQLIDESLEFYGVKTRDEARDIVQRARARSGMTDEQALDLASEQVRESRNT
jgi:hypothetical protein